MVTNSYVEKIQIENTGSLADGLWIMGVKKF